MLQIWKYEDRQEGLLRRDLQCHEAGSLNNGSGFAEAESLLYAEAAKQKVLLK
jgi:hypothetical protein